MVWYNVEHNRPDKEERTKLLKQFIDKRNKKEDLSNIKETIILEYLPFIKYMVSKYSNKHGLSFDECMQSGTLGFLQALNKVNKDKLDTFLGYSKIYIYKELVALLGYNYGTIKRTSTMQQQISKYRKAVKELKKEDKEIDMDNIREKTGFTVKTIKGLENIKDGASLDYCISEDGLTLLDTIGVEDKDINMEFILDNIDKYVSTKEYRCIKLYYLEDQNLQEIADQLDVSAEYVRQLIDRGLDKLNRVFN